MPPNRLLHHLKLPSPVRRLATGERGAELWLKDDGALGTVYGGNKARKLHLILPHAKSRAAKRLVTFGAAGSHHVLATTLLGRRAGFGVKALLFPQPSSQHALGNLRAALAAGLDAVPVASLKAIPVALARELRAGDYLIPAGGSGPVGAQAYYRAAGELAGQVDDGLLPAPDVIVVALGSGGTAAGLLAGLVASGLDCVVCAVDVSVGNRASGWWVRGLASWLARRRHLGDVRELLANRLLLETNYRGSGYGSSTPAAIRALEIGAEWDVPLETTYTAKAFAKALELGSFPGYDASCWPRRRAREQPAALASVLRASGRPLRVLYWHTLSRIVPPAPQGFELPPRLMKQFPRP